MVEDVLNKIRQIGLTFLVLLIIFFALFYKNTGRFPKTADLVLGLERFVPLFPNQEVNQDESLPQEIINIQSNMLNEITSNYDSEGCLIKYSLNGLGDYAIELSNREGQVDSLVLKTPENSKGSIKISHQVTKGKGMQICMVDPVEFYHCYLDYLKPKSELCKQLYKLVTSIQLTEDHISIDENNPKFLLQGTLFRPEKGKACFITMRTASVGCDRSDNGLDKGCIDQLKTKLPYC